MLLLLWMLAGRRMRRVPEQIRMWTWGGTLLGGFAFSPAISDTPAQKIGACFSLVPVAGRRLAGTLRSAAWPERCPAPQPAAAAPAMRDEKARRRLTTFSGRGRG